DHLAAIVDHAHRRCLYRHVQTSEMLHLIAPSSMIEVARPRSAITREGGRALIIQGEHLKGQNRKRPTSKLSFCSVHQKPTFRRVIGDHRARDAEMLREAGFAGSFR